MSDIYTSKENEDTIRRVIQYGLKVSGTSKWKVLRIALATSLKLKTEPDASLDVVPTEGRKEYRLSTVTGEGKADTEEMPQDWDATTRGMLSVYHKVDLFSDEAYYRKLLQRHIRRGLREIDISWKSGSDFHAWLNQEFFSGLQSVQTVTVDSQDKLIGAFAEIGLPIEIIDTNNGPRLTRYKIHLSDINHLDKLKRGGLDKLANLLGVQQQGISQQETNEPKSIYLDIPRSKDSWELKVGDDLRQWVQTFLPKNYRLPVWLGVNVTGQPYFFDLAETPHLFVAGTTGSGKSVCLHALIISLLERMRETPEALQLALIDPKQVELAVYESLPNLFAGKVFGDSDVDTIALLTQLLDEMEARNTLFKTVGVTNIDEALDKGEQLPRIVVIIEELADLIMGSKEIESYIVRLAQKARSAGIHLVLATQRPDSQVFKGLLRSNIPSRIALSVQKSTESKIIIDEVGAEKLLGKGDMLIKLGSDPVVKRVHGVFVNRDDSAKAVKQFIKG